MITTTIPFAKLRGSDANVRKSSTYAAAGIAALAASIAGHGLLQPLIVSPSRGRKSLFDVHAGGRRLAALALLVEAGKLGKDHPVEVRLCEDEDAAARELSLAENLLHEPMTAAEECTAYRDIIAEGASAEDVARRFGVTVRHVHGRMRLADLAEPIFAALAEGTITLDVAMAYGATSDRAAQLSAWERYSDSWAADNPQAIRRAIAETGLSGRDPLALLVGESEYQAAGGRIERDLFAAEGEGTWIDADIARDLAMKKLTFEAEVAQLATKLAWVKPVAATRVPYDDTRDLQGYFPDHAEPSPEAQERMAEIERRHEEIEEEIERAEDEDAAQALYDEQERLSAEYDALRKTDVIIPDEDREHVGTFLVIGQDGTPELVDRYYTAKSVRSDSAQADTGKRTATARAMRSIPRKSRPASSTHCRAVSRNSWRRIAATSSRSTSPTIPRWRSTWRSSASRATRRGISGTATPAARSGSPTGSSRRASRTFRRVARASSSSRSGSACPTTGR
jgi:ParB family chromosome partitioning protein